MRGTRKVAVGGLEGTIAAAQAGLARLLEIQTATADLDLQRQAMLDEANQISAGLTEVALPRRAGRKPSKAGRPAKSGTGKRGRPVGSGRKAATGGSGKTLPEYLLDILPGVDQEGITKDAMIPLLTKAGFTTKATDPKVVVGQALSKGNWFTTSARGQWRLTKFGVNHLESVKSGTTSATPKAKRGRPAGSKNKTKTTDVPATTVTAPAAAAPVAVPAPAVGATATTTVEEQM